jgi:hypothetical protein
MRFLIFMLTILVSPIATQAQGPSGDFRSMDRPATMPLVGPSGVPGVPPDPMRFGDTIGSRPSQDILKSIDKDLGRSTIERPDERAEIRLWHRPGEDLGKGPPTTFK